MQGLNHRLCKGNTKQNFTCTVAVKKWTPWPKPHRFERSQDDKAGLLEQQLGTPRSRHLLANDHGLQRLFFQSFGTFPCAPCLFCGGLQHLESSTMQPCGSSDPTAPRLKQNLARPSFSTAGQVNPVSHLTSGAHSH